MRYETVSPRSTWPWLFLLVTLGIGLGGFALFLLNRNLPVPASWGVAGGARNGLGELINSFQQALITPGVASIFGVLILRRQSRHRIGWLLIALGLITASTVLLAEWAAFGYFSNWQTPGTDVAAWVTNWIWIVLITLVLLMIALFPSGHFLSARWRALYTSCALLFLLPGLIATTIETPMSSAFQIPNPFVSTQHSRLYDTFFTFALAFMLVTILIVLLSTIFRYRRGLGVERAQIKWLLSGVVIFALMVLAGVLLAYEALFVRGGSASGAVATRGAFGAFTVNAAPLAVLLSIGIAMVRHQLYDIDFLIRRTTSYALLTGLLAVVYAGSVILLQYLLSPMTGDSTIAVVLSTLLIAALFLPVRRKVQEVIDRRFFRQKYDAQKTLEQFAHAARDETDLDTLTAELLRVIQETMQPEHVSVWLKATAAGETTDDRPQTTA